MENLLHVNYDLLLEELENRNQINKKIDTKRTCVFRIRRMRLQHLFIRLGLRHSGYIVSNARYKNSELLAFCRHDLIMFNHLPKILIDKKSKTRGEKSQLWNYVEENTLSCKSLIWFT